jgi:hypothetical protein
MEVLAPTVCAHLTCNSSNVMTKSTFSPILSFYSWGLIVHHCITDCKKKKKSIAPFMFLGEVGAMIAWNRYITVNVYEIINEYTSIIIYQIILNP